MNRETIKKLALANGFKLKEQPDGIMELNPYVYEFAKALVADVEQERDALAAQVEAWKAVSGKHLEVASSCLEEKRRLLLKTFIAGCDAGQKYGSNPFERDRQFDYFMADLRQQAKVGDQC